MLIKPTNTIEDDASSAVQPAIENTIVISFRERYMAEMFIVAASSTAGATVKTENAGTNGDAPAANGPRIPSLGLVKMNWVPNSAVPATTSNGANNVASGISNGDANGGVKTEDDQGTPADHIMKMETPEEEGEIDERADDEDGIDRASMSATGPVAMNTKVERRGRLIWTLPSDLSLLCPLCSGSRRSV